VRDRLFVDGRRLGLSRLQVGQSGTS
jgi:hypothetical protein